MGGFKSSPIVGKVKREKERERERVRTSFKFQWAAFAFLKLSVSPPPFSLHFIPPSAPFNCNSPPPVLGYKTKWASRRTIWVILAAAAAAAVLSSSPSLIYSKHDIAFRFFGCRYFSHLAVSLSLRFTQHGDLSVSAHSRPYSNSRTVP